MRTKFVEVTNGGNWGKFLVCEFTPEEWAYRSRIDPTERSLIWGRGWRPKARVVLDLQTGEGALFMPGGRASADLNKTRLWVCPMFEPFLTWLYQQPQPLDIDALPEVVELNVPGALYGYRRPGPKESNDRNATASSRVRRHGDDGAREARVSG